MFAFLEIEIQDGSFIQLKSLITKSEVIIGLPIKCSVWLGRKLERRKVGRNLAKIKDTKIFTLNCL